MAERGEVGALQADQRVGAHDQFPPALDAGVVGDAVVGPAQVILRVLEAILDPGAQAEGVAHALPDLSRQVGHEVPGRLGGQGLRVGGDLVVAHGSGACRRRSRG